MELTEKKVLEKIAEARQFYSRQAYPQAIAIYTEVKAYLRDDRENLPVIQIELGWSYYHNQQYEAARDQMLQAMNSGKLTVQQEFDCLRLAGFCEELLGRRPEAIAYLQRAISMDVTELVKRFAYFELGKIYFIDGQMLESEHHFNHCGALFEPAEKNYYLAWLFYMGFISFFQKNYQQAREHFDRVVQQGEDHTTRASGYFGLAHIYHQQKAYPVVVDLCEKIMRMDSTFFDKESLGYLLCDSFLHLQDWENLENFFSQMKGNYPAGRFQTEYARFEQALQTRQTPAAAGKA